MAHLGFQAPIVPGFQTSVVPAFRHPSSRGFQTSIVQELLGFQIPSFPGFPGFATNLWVSGFLLAGRLARRGGPDDRGLVRTERDHGLGGRVGSPPGSITCRAGSGGLPLRVPAGWSTPGHRLRPRRGAVRVLLGLGPGREIRAAPASWHGSTGCRPRGWTGTAATCSHWNPVRRSTLRDPITATTVRAFDIDGSDQGISAAACTAGAELVAAVSEPPLAVDGMGWKDGRAPGRPRGPSGHRAIDDQPGRGVSGGGRYPPGRLSHRSEERGRSADRLREDPSSAPPDGRLLTRRHAARDRPVELPGGG